MKRHLFFTAILMLFISVINAQDENKSEFVPSGKPFATIYSNFHGGIGNDNSNSHAFEIERAYLGYQYQLSEVFSGKVNLDVGNPKDGGDFELTMYLKEASLNYKKGNLTGKFGLIGLYQFKTSENVWGHRYVYKTVQDIAKMGSSADAGIYLEYKIHDMISVDATMVNGEGYKKLQSNNTYKNAFGLTLKPIKGFILRGYYDMYPKTINQTTASVFAGYEKKDKFAVGAEYAQQSNQKNVDGQNVDALSGFGSYNVTSKWQVFGRYDYFNNTKSNQLVIGGVQFAPVKGIKLAANYRALMTDTKTESFVFVNCEVKI